MKFCRIALLFVLACFSVRSFAEPEFLELFLDHYHVKDTSPLMDKNCTICHVSDEDHHFNAYGADLKKAKAQTDNKFSWQTLAIVEPMDSNGDGRTNLQKITLGISPGDVAPLKPGQAPPPPVKKPLIPRHAFHPAIVHFPIALIIVAVVLDLIGTIGKKPLLHKMATYNLWLGTACGFAAIASGVGAMYFKQLPYKGTILTHLTVAIAAMVMALISIATRGRPGKVWQVIGFITIIGAGIAIGFAGHFGGDFVYGE